MFLFTTNFISTNFTNPSEPVIKLIRDIRGVTIRGVLIPN